MPDLIDSDGYAHLRASFDRMPIVRTLGLSIIRIGPGVTEMEMAIHDGLCFRPGQVQATPLFAIADFAAVGAAATLLPAGWTNTTVDTTLKLIRPAHGRTLRARGWVVRAGRLLSVCAADVFAIDGNDSVLCATLLATAHNVEPAPTREASQSAQRSRARKIAPGNGL